MGTKPIKKIQKSFKEAVESTDEVKRCFQAGKQALEEKDRNKIEFADNKKCGGSLFIDKCLSDQKKYPNDNRWDYAIDYNSEVFFIEVHTASSGEVSTVIDKLKWLKTWLRTAAPEIDKLKATSRHPFYWVQSGGFNIPRHSKQYRLVEQLNIKPISKLVLK
jgi:hypothetical protein